MRQPSSGLTLGGSDCPTAGSAHRRIGANGALQLAICAATAGATRVGSHVRFHGVGYLQGLCQALTTTALLHNVNVRALSYILGHKDPSTTLRIYAHVMSADVEGAADRIGEAFTLG